ncbi:MAG: RIP metalloprotease RseP [Myxococcaceae bacterium]|nr:RIP metalloprotease RseP [Myxococcaceae bacterium]MCI0671357.1 RIP metalloprotease RseP [Myxococcaceae bacterium]
MLDSLRGIAVFALLLGVLVFVHELGHFLAAKACGVKVLRFSFGFGPRLFGFRKGETDYCLSLLPLGGYVLMAGAHGHEELPPGEEHRSLLAKTPWQRTFIAAMGPFFSLAFPVLVYFFLFLGPQERLAARVGSVEPASPAAAAGLRPGDRILVVEGQPIRTFDDMVDAFRPVYGRPVAVTMERDGRPLVAEVTPIKVDEPTEAGTVVSRGVIGVSPFVRRAVVGVPAGSPAAAAGLQTFDRIVAVNGQPVANESELHRALAAASGTVTLSVERPDPDAPQKPAEGEETEAKPPPGTRHEVRVERQPGEGDAAIGAERADLYVAAVEPGSSAEGAGLVRGDRLVAIDGKPLESQQFLQYALQEKGSAPFALTWRSGGVEKQARVERTQLSRKNELGHTVKTLDLGVRLSPPQDPSNPELVKVTYGVGEAMKKSFEVVPRAIGFVATVILRLFTGKVSFETVGGPILLYQVATKSAEAGVKPFLDTMAIISINLGLVNLLPIPVLDGFSILVGLWEGVRRRPVTMRAREVANFIGLAMLVLLMVLVMINDITR